MSSTNPPPGWHPDPQNPSAGVRWWDGTQWTNQVQPFAGPPPPAGQWGTPSGPGAPAGPFGGAAGPFGGAAGPYGSAGPFGGRRGFGGRGRYGASSATFWGRNQASFTTIIVAAIYIGIALATRFVLLGIVPLFMSMRAVRAREQLAPLAIVAAIATIVIGIATIAR